MKRRLLALLLVLLMCATFVGYPALAQGDEAVEDYGRLDPREVDPSRIISLANGSSSKAAAWETVSRFVEAPNPDEILTVIVELEAPPLGADAASIASVQSLQDTLVQEQRSVLSQLNEVNPDAEMLYSYTAVLNGFATQLRYRDVETLKNNPSVKNVYLSNTYELPVTPDDSVSNDMVSAPSAWTRGYDGAGTLIAIIDTGVDYNHPQLSSLDAENQITEEQMAERVAAAGQLNATTGSYYKNPKVIFAYDYYSDKESHVDAIGHGTHVAGIAAANSTDEGVVIGTAYNAQLMAMKVFSPFGGASDVTILAAVDDAVKLGADAINLSLGSPAGFTSFGELDEFYYDTAFKNALEAGTFVSCSAGNEAHLGYVGTPMGYLFGILLPYAQNPDFGVVGTPSTDVSAVSVASVDNLMSYLAYFQAGDLSIPFTDTNDQPFSATFDGNELEYVCVPGLGSGEDYEGLDLEGKVALISRGELSFADKAYFAWENGAVAAIIHNNTTGSLNMDLTGAPIPAIFIEQSYGEAMREAGNGTVSFSTEYAMYMESSTGGEISDFSSRGVTSDLKLKPEITAPGGGIYSTYPVDMGSYTNMSGTSMSAPHIAAGAALIKQRVLQEFPGLTPEEAILMTENLMMSSATILNDPQGNPYPPYSQGAGLMNLQTAVETPVILYNKYDHNTKVELGDQVDPEEITVPFILENLTDEEVRLNLSGVVMADEAMVFVNPEDDTDMVTFNSLNGTMSGGMKSLMVSGAGFTGGIVTLDANAKCEITMVYTLSAAAREKLAIHFPNGYYVYGFATLTSIDDIPCEVSIPYLGFAGDWTVPPIMDSHTVYEPDELGRLDDLGFYSDNSLMKIAYEDGGWHKFAAGVNDYTWDFADMSHISFSPFGNSEYSAVTAHVTPLRSAKTVGAEILDSEGNVVRTMESDVMYIPKAYPDGDMLASYDFDELGITWDGRDNDGNPVPEGGYRFQARFTLDYPGAEEKPQYWGLPVFVDNSPPTFEWTIEETDGKTLLNVTASDNHYLCFVGLRDRREMITGYALAGYSDFATPEPFDITEYIEKYGSVEAAMMRLNVYAQDYADNFAYDTLTPAPPFPEVTRFECTPVYYVDGCAAYMVFELEGTGLEGLDIKAVFADGLEVSLTTGRNRIYFPMISGSGFQFVDLYVEGAYEGYTYFIINPLPQGIWEATAAQAEDGNIAVYFADAIYNPPKAKVNGVYVETDHYDFMYNQIHVKAPYASGTVVTLEKVKFDRLFPSYSFKYTVTCP